MKIETKFEMKSNPNKNECKSIFIIFLKYTGISNKIGR